MVGHGGADDEEQVRLIEEVSEGAVAADATEFSDAEAEGVVVGEGALAGGGAGDGGAEGLGELAEFVGGVGEHDAASDPDDGALGVSEGVGGLFDGGWIRWWGCGVAGGEDFNVGLFVEEVSWDFELDGAGSAGGEALEGFEEVVGHGFEVVDEGVPAGDGAEHSELVFGLVDCAFAGVDEFEFGVGGDLEDFGGGVVGLAHGAHAVGGAGAAAGEEDAGLAGDAGVSVGHEAEGVLVAAADESDGVLLMVEGVVDVHGVGGDDAEDGVDVVGLEALDDGFSAGHEGHFSLLGLRDWADFTRFWGWVQGGWGDRLWADGRAGLKPDFTRAGA